MTDPVTGNRRQLAEPPGIRIFGMLIIISSLLQMGKLAGSLGWYNQIFSYMPPWLMAVRYYFSWGLRFVGLAAGIGILCRREISRKILIAIALFTIATVYWKHPYLGFKLHAHYLDRQYVALLAKYGMPRDSFASLASVSMWTNIAADIIFNGSLIFYVTRPRVRAWFAMTQEDVIATSPHKLHAKGHE